ncbi:unnamed protein product [Brassicogethes aeneus]|uniref:Small ribosomal subunit protein mS31 n=1 Tax=Brassicogethes aeneus TaxID=1431903 RepID=A0A9P0FBF5_BRAAE|nr:unnamed protein product [Brassicogethes aeneus]
MNKLHLFLRTPTLNRKLLNPTSCLKEICSNKSFSSESDNNDKKPKKEEAISKLNDLLKKMLEDDVQLEPKIKLAQPSYKKEKFSKKKSISKEPVKENIVKAVKDVANTIPGDPKITESELLTKLLTPAVETPATYNLSDIVKGMKIDRETKPSERQTRAEQVKNILQRFKPSDQNLSSSNQRSQRRQQIPKKTVESSEKIDLFGSAPLGIFTKKEYIEGVENKTWKSLNERELKLAITHPPANYYQEMILWTEQGKIWKFPIDNEQGMESDSVSFDEHVFLERHLEGWCPSKGPIRHFMELVCVGLSKNPYISADAKKEHIMWYKNYFEDKKKLLLEVGAFPAETKSKQKSVE